MYLTCSKKLTGSQVSLPHGINKKIKMLLDLATTSRRHSSRCTGYLSVNESPTNCAPWCIQCSTVRLHHIYLRLLLQSTRPCPPTFGEKRRLRHSTCTLLIRSAFVLGVWTWCLEQSASSAERHRCCLNLQTSLKVWTLLSSLRRFDHCFNRCWSLRLFALLIEVFFHWRYVCFLHF